MGLGHFRLFSKQPHIAISSVLAPPSVYCITCIKNEGGNFLVDVTMPVAQMWMSSRRSNMFSSCRSCICVDNEVYDDFK